MSTEIYLRPLQEKDAERSYLWRNDSDVWKFTGSKPDIYVTPEIEKEWIQKILQRPDEKRFAICLKENDQYIGNVQLTGINDYDGEFHVFIGEKSYWGKGIGTCATNLLVEHAFSRWRAADVPQAYEQYFHRFGLLPSHLKVECFCCRRRNRDAPSVIPDYAALMNRRSFKAFSSSRGAYTRDQSGRCAKENW